MVNNLRHFLPPYLTTPNKEIRCLLVGAGGNGGPMITGLARMNAALNAIGHAGISLDVADCDFVAPENIGRQLFSVADIGRNKAECLVTRVNMFFGLDWRAFPVKFVHEHIKTIKPSEYKIIIAAVDNVLAREIVHLAAKESMAYYLDLGNSRDSGQVILGTGTRIAQPKKTVDCITYLPTVLDLYPNMRDAERESYQGPSCSMAEALKKQDLFINTAVSTFALDLLWKGLKNGYLTHHGAFINLSSYRVNPLPINPEVWRQMGFKIKAMKEAA